MGRNVRKVPGNWQHPKDAKGLYIPLFGGPYSVVAAQWDKDEQDWNNGFCDDGTGKLVELSDDQKGHPYSWYDDERPKAKDFMPEWPEEQRTHFMMYETTTEGTPISPTFETKEELAHWLTNNNVSVFADNLTDFEGWMNIIQDD